MNKRLVFCLSVFFVLQAGLGFCATPLVPPFVADVPYGPDPKQKFDIYRPATGSGPFPIIFSIHGGGWFGGDKKQINGGGFLNQGCAVVSINYRLVQDATAEHISPPVTAVLDDCRRALQDVRLHASDWNLDPARITIFGGSAGATAALYLACAGEKANPDSKDPVERVSTRVLGVGMNGAATSFDPQTIRQWNPGVVWGYWACEPDGKNYSSLADFNKYLADRDKWLPTILKYSPDHLVSRNTPPLYFSYTEGLPVTGVATPPFKLIHSPLWAIGFQKLAEKQGVTCYLSYPGHPSEPYPNMVRFLLHQLGMDAK